MCANLGWFNLVAPTTKKKELLKHLARKSQAFGDKSFGLAAKKEGEVVLVRYTASASQWLEQNSKELEKYAASPTLIGHTRLPTHGAVTKVNCHPFPLGDWLACHNGVIRNSARLLLKARLTARGETDSEEALAYVVGEDWSPAALNEIDGSFALVGLKKDLRSGILVCDDRQSLHFVKVGDGIVWSTSSEILVSSLAAAGIQHADVVKMESVIVKLPSLEVTPFEVHREAPSYHYPTSWDDKPKRGRKSEGTLWPNSDEPPACGDADGNLYPMD